MKKLACASAILGIALVCSACATPSLGAATPTPAPQTTASSTIAPTPPHTPEPSPTPIGPPEAERAYMALAEDAAFSLAFVDMPPDQVAPYAEALGGDYDVYGRTAGEDASYLIAVRRADAPIPSDYREVSLSHDYRDDGMPGEMTIQYIDTLGTPHDLYTIDDAYGAHAIHEAFDLQSICIALQPGNGAPHPALTYMFTEHGRARLAFYRENPAFLLENLTAQPRIAISLQNEQTALFVSAPQDYDIAIPDDAEQHLMSLLAKAEKVTSLKRGGRAHGMVFKSTPNAYQLGVAVVMTGKRYDLYGVDGKVGLIALQLGDDAPYERGYDAQLLRSEEAATALLDIVLEATGRDYASFTPGWFDEPLASATLAFPNLIRQAEDTTMIDRRTQTIDDPQELETLRKMLAKGVRGHSELYGCPYTAPLHITRADGETMLIMLASDGCDSMAVMGSIGFSYGEQADMRSIFDEAMRGWK